MNSVSRRAALPQRLDEWAPSLLKAQVYGRLLLDIIIGVLKPGEQLDENVLARRYDGGLAGIRDALARLALEGLVVRKARVGTTVAPLDLSEARDAFEARRLVEIQCAGLAASQGSDAAVTAIRATLANGEAAIQADDARALAEMDEAFHVAVATASGNRTLAKMVVTLHHQTARYWLISMKTPGRAESLQALQEHRALADTIAARDPVRARAQMEQVLGELPDDVKRSLEIVIVTPFRAWTTLLLVSALFFLVTAATFNALGPAIGAMAPELHWSGSEAGAGFSLLGVFCGITATLPALLIRRVGVRFTLVLGGVVMAAAFACLAMTHGVLLYFAGCSLAGLGFTLLATVPATYLLARSFVRPGFIFGLYFTLGQGGAVAGPLLYLWIAGASGWRMVWIVSGVAILVTALLAALLVDTKADVAASAEHDPEITRESWTVRAALRTPQFLVLAAAYSVFLFVDITVNAFSIPHLMGHGVEQGVAIGLLSLGALINAGGRLGGGLLSRVMDARPLLAFALLLLAGGLLALCFGSGPLMLFAYAAGIGFGSGLTFFASTILLLDYFGRKPNLELFAAVNLISTVGSIGPAFAGFVSDRTHSFLPAFLILAVLVVIILLAVLRMKPPQRAAA